MTSLIWRASIRCIHKPNVIDFIPLNAGHVWTNVTSRWGGKITFQPFLFGNIRPLSLLSDTFQVALTIPLAPRAIPSKFALTYAECMICESNVIRRFTQKKTHFCNFYLNIFISVKNGKLLSNSWSTTLTEQCQETNVGRIWCSICLQSLN